MFEQRISELHVNLKQAWMGKSDMGQWIRAEIGEVFWCISQSISNYDNLQSQM